MYNRFQQELVDTEVFCIYHPYNQSKNQAYLYCEECDTLVCDRCKTKDHNNHRIEAFFSVESYESMLIKFQNFQKRLHDKIYNDLNGFKDKIITVEAEIENFFLTQEKNIDNITREFIEFINLMTKQNKELLQQYKIEFRENLTIILNDYDKVTKELDFISKKINEAKKTMSNEIFSNRFSYVKTLSGSKSFIEKEYKKLYHYYNFDLNCLISEFTIKDYLAYLENNKRYLENLYYEEKNLIMRLSIEDKIKNIILMDHSKKTSKNILPKNVSNIYMPVDRTNFLNSYDIETSTFTKHTLIIEKLKNFTFNQYCRYVNFGGRLFITGGFEEKKISNTCIIIEDAKNFMDPFGRKLHFMKETEVVLDDFNIPKINPSSKNVKFISKENHYRKIVDPELYQTSLVNINKKLIYSSLPSPNIKIMKAESMIYGHAGHAVAAISPNYILVISGVDGCQKCEIYKINENVWEEMSDVSHPRIDPGILINNDYVYIFFGISYNRFTKKCEFLNTIERINFSNIINANWEVITPQLDNFDEAILKRSLCGVVQTNSSNIIYILGGQIEKEKFSDTIFQYDLQLNFISIKKETLPKKTAFLEQNFIYIFKKAVNYDIFGDVFFYDTIHDSFNFQYRKIANDNIC